MELPRIGTGQTIDMLVHLADGAVSELKNISMAETAVWWRTCRAVGYGGWLGCGVVGRYQGQGSKWGGGLAVIVPPTNPTSCKPDRYLGTTHQSRVLAYT